jgi:hypothetical protein
MLLKAMPAIHVYTPTGSGATRSVMLVRKSWLWGSKPTRAWPASSNPTHTVCALRLGMIAFLSMHSPPPTQWTWDAFCIVVAYNLGTLLLLVSSPRISRLLLIPTMITVQSQSQPTEHSGEQWHAIETAREEQKEAAAKTLPLPFRTLTGECYSVHNWFGSGPSGVRTVAASQCPALGPSGDVQKPDNASLPSCCCGW